MNDYIVTIRHTILMDAEIKANSWAEAKEMAESMSWNEFSYIEDVESEVTDVTEIK